MRKILALTLCLFSLLLCSCGEDGKIIFPFEADFEKHYTALERSADGASLDAENYIDSTSTGVILENDAYSVGISGEDGALWFYDKAADLYYDMNGAALPSSENADTALHILKDNEPFLDYVQGEFYDTVYEKYRPSLTAFYIDENTVRMIYVLGLDQLEYITEYPVVLTPETYAENEFIFSNHYKKAEAQDHCESFMNEYCSADDYYVLYTYPLPEAAKLLGEINASDARFELLSLGYNPDNARICMFVTDVTLDDDKITVDISPNRQYRTSSLRTSQYKVSFFEGQPPFVEKTESDSEKISFAGSKFG